MLESTQELADLLPLELRQGVVSYIDEINVVLDTLAGERQFRHADAIRPQMELIFFSQILVRALDGR